MKTTCGILLIDPSKRILVCHPTRHDPDQWDIVKGQVDPNELKLDAMIREFHEETGQDLTRICSDIIDYSKIHNIDFVYTHKKKKLHGFVGFLHEHLDIAYFKCDSMVTGFKDLPDFPEVDSFAWIAPADKDILHESQQRFVQHVHRNTEYLDMARFVKLKKSHLYG